jgi:ubiquinone/menaquinone biosynthesis C-methylase UbiE
MKTTVRAYNFLMASLTALALTYTTTQQVNSQDMKPSSKESSGCTEKHGHDEGSKHDHQNHSSSKHMHKRFDDAEKWAEKFDDPKRDDWQKPDQVVESLALPDGAVLADIGAGTGYFAVRLAKRYPKSKIIAVDIEPDMVAYVSNRAKAAGLKNVETSLAFADKPQTLSEKADVIFIADTYHHIPDRDKYFSHLRDSLKPDGQLVIIDFKLESPEGPPIEHRIQPHEVREELKDAGFEQAKAIELLPYQYFLVFKQISGTNH